VGGDFIERMQDGLGRSVGVRLASGYEVGYAFEGMGRMQMITYSNMAAGVLRTALYSYVPGSDLLASLSNGPVQVSRGYEAHRNLLTGVTNKAGANLNALREFISFFVRS
jgi:hypothetical protein